MSAEMELLLMNMISKANGFTTSILRSHANDIPDWATEDFSQK